jgi:hypothetical protein
LELAPAGLALSIITYGELYEGAYYSRNPEAALAGLHAFLEGKKILPLSQAVIEGFAIVRGALPGRLGSKSAIWTSWLLQRVLSIIWPFFPQPQGLSANPRPQALPAELTKSDLANPTLFFSLPAAFLYCWAFNSGKDTRGFLFCKAKMHDGLGHRPCKIHFPIFKNIHVGKERTFSFLPKIYGRREPSKGGETDERIYSRRYYSER